MDWCSAAYDESMIIFFDQNIVDRSCQKEVEGAEGRLGGGQEGAWRRKGALFTTSGGTCSNGTISQ